MSLSPNPADRRREERNPFTGQVLLQYRDVEVVKLQGSLLDKSRNGFRVAHPRCALSAGQEVSFSHAEATGRARVIWTLIAGQNQESGFLVLECRQPS
jgi:hypothetical protein